MSTRTIYCCDFCGKDLASNDVGGGVEWVGETQTGLNIYANPRTMIIKFFIDNKEADTHMCYGCRKKLLQLEEE